MLPFLRMNDTSFHIWTSLTLPPYSFLFQFLVVVLPVLLYLSILIYNRINLSISAGPNIGPRFRSNYYYYSSNCFCNIWMRFSSFLRSIHVGSKLPTLTLWLWLFGPSLTSFKACSSSVLAAFISESRSNARKDIAVLPFLRPIASLNQSIVKANADCTSLILYDNSDLWISTLLDLLACALNCNAHKLLESHSSEMRIVYDSTITARSRPMSINTPVDQSAGGGLLFGYGWNLDVRVIISMMMLCIWYC